MLALIVLVGWVIVIALCQLGIWHPKFRDTWLQYVAMWGLTLFGVLRIDRLIERGTASEEAALLAASLAMYAIGVAVKTYRHRNDPATKLRTDP